MAVDPSATVAASARVDPQAVIGAHSVIGEFCVIESDVVMGAHCRLEPYVFVKRWTTMGDRNEISAGTVLGTDPLDKVFTGDRQLSPHRAAVTVSGNTIRFRAARSRNR